MRRWAMSRLLTSHTVQIITGLLPRLLRLPTTTSTYHTVPPYSEPSSHTSSPSYTTVSESYFYPIFVLYSTLILNSNFILTLPFCLSPASYFTPPPYSSYSGNIESPSIYTRHSASSSQYGEPASSAIRYSDGCTSSTTISRDDYGVGVWGISGCIRVSDFSTVLKFMYISKDWITSCPVSMTILRSSTNRTCIPTYGFSTSPLPDVVGGRV